MRRYFPSSVLSRLVVLPLAVCLGVTVVLAAVTGRLSADSGAGTALAVATDTRPTPAPGTSPVLAARAALRGGVKHPSLQLTRLALAYPELSDWEKEQADALLARPTDSAADPYLDGYERSAEVRTRCTEHVCLHWVTTTEDAPPPRDLDLDGTPDWVERIVPKVKAVWAYEVDTLGFRPPAPDGTRGGDARLDLYLAELGDQGVYGYCPAERPVRGEDYLYSGYCVLDNDFREFPLDPMPSFRVTLAHEMFHVVQYAYDAAEDPWLMEASSTWMEERFADGVDDNRQYLPYGQLGDPSVPLDQFPAGIAPYGNWAFVEALAQAHGDDAVRAVWERANASVGEPDEFSTQALNRFLRRHGSSLREFYAEFAAGNLAPTSLYPEAAEAGYPAAPVVSTITLRSDRSSVTRERLLDHLTSTTLAFRPGGDLSGRWRLQLALQLPPRGRGANVVVVVERVDGTRVARPVSLDRTGAAIVRSGFDPGRVRRVLVTLTNSSLRFSCWRDSSFSCQGVSQDDRITTYQVGASLLPPSRPG